MSIEPSTRIATAGTSNLQPLLIRSLFESACAHRTSSEIVDRNGARHSYSDFAARVQAAAHGLKAQGVEAGAVVAVLDWDSVRYLELYFAVPMIGGILQMVNPRLPLDHLGVVLRDGGARILLCHQDFAPLAAAALGGESPFDTTIGMSDDPALCEYEGMIGASSAPFDFPDFDENSVATLFHTSGTTGLPKAVSYTHRQLVLQTISTIAALGMQPEGQDLKPTDVYMPLTPMFHVHAWGLPFVATVMGLTQVYPGKYEPEKIIALYNAERVSFSHCVPTVLQMILDHPGARQDFLGWKMVIGGSALPEALHLAARDRGISAFAGYGMSETGPLVSIARTPTAGDAPDPAAPLRAGHPVPLVAIRIADERGNPLPHDGVAQGELQLRSPWLTMTYVGNDEASEQLWDGGWLHTQDVATISPDGTIAICDRIKDLVKSGGEWISPAAIENILMGDEAVATAAIVAAADARWGECPVAFVTAAEDRPIDIARLTDLAKQAATAGKISRYAVPRSITVLDALPLTSVGKIDKLALRRLAADAVA